MNLRDARTIPPEQLFERRKQAVALFKKGMTRGEIGITRGAGSLAVNKLKFCV